MGEYNYSAAFLKQHEDLVNQLIDLARTGEAAEASFKTPDEARRYRNLVLNLKRSLAMHRPELTAVHNTLRTKITRSQETGDWIIRVGPEALLAESVKGKIRGRTDKMIQPGQLGGNILSIPGVITSETFAGVMFKLAQAKTVTKPDYIQFEEPLPPEAIEHLSKELAPEYEVIKTTPKLVLERQVQRIDASAIIALAREGKQP